MSWSAEKIAEIPHLAGHLSTIKVYSDTGEVVRQKAKKSARHTAIVGLLLRTFDATLHSVRTACSGNYSVSQCIHETAWSHRFC